MKLTEDSASTNSSSLGAEPRPTRARVLLVDSDAVATRKAKAILERAGYEVFVATGGSQALNWLGDQRVDVIVTEAEFPMMSGYDFIRVVRRNPIHSATPILMLTKRREREDVKRALEVGVTEYMLKPVDELLLLDKVSICLKRSEIEKQTYEHKLNDAHAVARVQLDCRLQSISETGIAVELPFAAYDGLVTHFDFPVFRLIGIQKPLLKLRDCIPVKETRGIPLYVAHYSFVGLPESDLRRIRQWMGRELSRRTR